jgi:hypothetical protein
MTCLPELGTSAIQGAFYCPPREPGGSQAAPLRGEGV